MLNAYDLDFSLISVVSAQLTNKVELKYSTKITFIPLT